MCEIRHLTSKIELKKKQNKKKFASDPMVKKKFATAVTLRKPRTFFSALLDTV